MLDRYVWQRPTTVIPAALVTFSISTFSPMGSGDGLGITTIQARKKTHQLPSLPNQQAAILVGLDINPDWVREQSTADSLVYGTVKPDGTVPAGINENYSYLVISSRDREISLLFEAGKEEVTIRYANHGEELRTKTVPLSRLAKQSYRTKKQRQRVSKYASALRTG